MSEGMPAPDWWIASDGNWYPPELHPDARPRAVTAALSRTSLTDRPTVDATVAEPVRHSNGTFPAKTETASTNGFHDIAPFERAPLEPARSVVAPSAGNDAPRSFTLSPAERAALERSIAARNRPRLDRQRRRIVKPTKTASASQSRGAIAVGLTLLALALIITIARAHDARPSLGQAVPTTEPSKSIAAPSSIAGDAAPNNAPTSAPGATGASSSSAGSPTTAGTGTSAPTIAGARVAPRVVSVFDLVKGNCLDGASLSDGLITTIRVVDCAETHTHEVYYSGRYPETTFDANKITSYANDTCLAQFAPYVGIDYARSRYQYLNIVPTQESWTKDNDRDVICVAFEEDATITGSIAGRAQ